jgi:hypothetical protein
MNQFDLAHDQLRRMRGMTGYYHERFFSDMRSVAVGVLALFVLGWSVAPEAFLLVPVVAILGEPGRFRFVLPHFRPALRRRAGGLSQSERRRTGLGCR